MAGVGAAGRRGVARLLLVCAVLAGLFLMHGAPATAAAGCHADASVLGAVPADGGGPMASHGSGTAPRRPAAVSRTGSAGTHGARATVPMAVHGATCVSTPARARGPLPVKASTTSQVVADAPVLAGRAAPVGRRWRRGPPPPGGRDLLLRVGVART